MSEKSPPNTPIIFYLLKNSKCRLFSNFPRTQGLFLIFALQLISTVQKWEHVRAKWTNKHNALYWMTSGPGDLTKNSILHSARSTPSHYMVNDVTSFNYCIRKPSSNIYKSDLTRVTSSFCFILHLICIQRYLSREYFTHPSLSYLSFAFSHSLSKHSWKHLKRIVCLIRKRYSYLSLY